MAIVFKKKPTFLEDTNHDPLDVLKNLSLLILRYERQVDKVLASSTKQSEIDGAVKTLAGLYKQHADISYDLGHPKKVPPKYVEPIYSPIRDQILYNMELDKTIDETESKFFEIMDSITEEEWEKICSRGTTETERKFFEIINTDYTKEEKELSH